MPAEQDGNRFLNPVPTRVGGLSLMFKMGPDFFFGAAARSPKSPLGPFTTDPRVYVDAPASGLRITWFGHASSLVEIDGIRVLIDPIWDERAAPTQWAGPKRFFAPTLALEDLPPIDVILISHDHYDHLDQKTVVALDKRGTRFVVPLGENVVTAPYGVWLESWMSVFAYDSLS